MRSALRRLPAGPREAVETLDDGSVLRVRIEVNGESARISFAGSSRVHSGNLNATPAIVRSVVLYVLRLLVAEPLPLNEGLLEPIEIDVPEGLLNPEFPLEPAQAPALFGGNVETSQRLTGLLLKALGLAASSQGTMNNVIFGTSRFGYYETVCGGCGAGPGFHGASAVHSHMTNTRITDAEVLEHRYPVRLERFAVRRGSGGRGRWRGGDGVIRELVFLEPMTLSVLGQHRSQGPFGLEGGESGRPARLHLVRKGGTVETLRSADGREVLPGDRLILETPGGGGYGAPSAQGSEPTPTESVSNNRPTAESPAFVGSCAGGARRPSGAEEGAETRAGERRRRPLAAPAARSGRAVRRQAADVGEVFLPHIGRLAADRAPRPGGWCRQRAPSPLASSRLSPLLGA